MLAVGVLGDDWGDDVGVPAGVDVADGVDAGLDAAVDGTLDGDAEAAAVAPALPCAANMLQPARAGSASVAATTGAVIRSVRERFTPRG